MVSALLNSSDVQVLIVDVQQKLLPVLSDGLRMVEKITVLLHACQLMKVPVTVAEQYPEGLGSTANALQPLLLNAPLFEKTTFSSFGCIPLQQHLWINKSQGKKVLLMVGSESHVCLLQSALEGIRLGYEVVVPWDAVASRNTQDKHLAEQRLRQSGCQIVSTEMVLFEWLKDKNHPHFKAVSSLIK